MKAKKLADISHLNRLNKDDGLIKTLKILSKAYCRVKNILFRRYFPRYCVKIRFLTPPNAYSICFVQTLTALAIVNSGFSAISSIQFLMLSPSMSTDFSAKGLTNLS
jgi:hypothetical protein